MFLSLLNVLVWSYSKLNCMKCLTKNAFKLTKNNQKLVIPMDYYPLIYTQHFKMKNINKDSAKFKYSNVFSTCNVRF